MDNMPENYAPEDNGRRPQMRKHAKWIGIALFAITLVFLVFASLLQYFYGLIGLGLTEIGLLIIALLGCLWLRSGWKETFPLKKPSFAESRGCVYVYIGTFSVTIGALNVLLYFFPGMNDVSEELSAFLSGNMVLLIVTASLLPGICEEALFRGTIQAAFGEIKSTAVKVFLIGFLFGLFHLDPYRLVPTMLLGMGLTYIMIKTGNLLYPVLMHLIHNLISVLPSVFDTAIADDAADAALGATELTGFVIFFAAIGMMFIPPGVRRLNGLEFGGEGKGMRVAYTAACIVALIAGLAVAGSALDITLPE